LSCDAAEVRRDHKSAVEDYGKAITLDPQNGDLYVSLGRIKLKLKDESGARRDRDGGFELIFGQKK